MLISTIFVKDDCWFSQLSNMYYYFVAEIAPVKLLLGDYLTASQISEYK